MSTCPENDLHSVYLDGELPPAYIKDYEAHVAGCPECQKKLASLRSVRKCFSEDSRSIGGDSAFLDQSFDRLKARMSYSRVTKQSNVLTLTGEKLKGGLKYVATGAVAAAVVALIIPVRMNGASGKSAAPNFQPVARTNMVLPANANVQVDGTLDAATLTQFFSEADSSENGSYNLASGGPQVAFPVGYGSQYASSYPQQYGSSYGYAAANRSAENRASLASYNVFGPVPEASCMMPTPQEGADQRQKGFSFRVSSPFGDISLEIGNGN